MTIYTIFLHDTKKKYDSPFSDFWPLTYSTVRDRSSWALGLSSRERKKTRRISYIDWFNHRYDIKAIIFSCIRMFFFSSLNWWPVLCESIIWYRSFGGPLSDMAQSAIWFAIGGRLVRELMGRDSMRVCQTMQCTMAGEKLVGTFFFRLWQGDGDWYHDFERVQSWIY